MPVLLVWIVTHKPKSKSSRARTHQSFKTPMPMHAATFSFALCRISAATLRENCREATSSCKFVVHKRMHNDHKMYSIASSRTLVPSSSTLKTQCRAEAGEHSIDIICLTTNFYLNKKRVGGPKSAIVGRSSYFTLLPPTIATNSYPVLLTLTTHRMSRRVGRGGCFIVALHDGIGIASRATMHVSTYKQLVHTCDVCDWRPAGRE